MNKSLEKLKKISFKCISERLQIDIYEINYDKIMFETLFNKVKKTRKKIDADLDRVMQYAINQWFVRLDELIYVMDNIDHTPKNIKSRIKEYYENDKIREVRNSLQHYLEREILEEEIKKAGFEKAFEICGEIYHSLYSFSNYLKFKYPFSDQDFKKSKQTGLILFDRLYNTKTKSQKSLHSS